MRIVLSMLLASLMAVSAATASPHMFMVTEPVDGEPGSLHAVIQAINEHPDFDSETQFIIRFELNEDLLLLTQSLPSIEKPRVSVQGPGQTVLEISGAGLHRIFTLAAGVEHFDISGLTLSSGNSGPVAAAGCLTSSSVTTEVVISDTHVRSCQGQWGGAVLAAGPVYVANSRFLSNTARGSIGAQGGAIFARDFSAPVEIRDSEFISNAAIADSCQFCSASGGALAINTAGTALIENSRFVGNGSGSLSGGGAVLALGAQLDIRSSYFESNAANLGSAIRTGVGSLRLRNSTFVSNRSGAGGAVSVYQADLWGRNNTFWRNSGSQGVDLQGSNLRSLVLTHHVHGHLDGKGGGPPAASLCNFVSLPVVVAIHHSIATDSSCQMTEVPELDVLGLEAFGDVRQLVVFNTSSPVVGGGSLYADASGSDPLGCEILDGRQVRRPRDGNGSGQARCDVGALEHGSFSLVFESGFEPDP